MSDFTLTAAIPRPFPEAVDRVRDALADQGFGIITEIDLSATLKAKLGVDVPEQLILGACRPELAHRALVADPSIAAMLPCNVVVRAVDEETSAVEAFDPSFMADLGGDAVRVVADDAGERIRAALASLGEG